MHGDRADRKLKHLLAADQPKAVDAVIFFFPLMYISKIPEKRFRQHAE